VGMDGEVLANAWTQIIHPQVNRAELGEAL
jgi:hypothetical protein